MFCLQKRTSYKTVQKMIGRTTRLICLNRTVSFWFIVGLLKNCKGSAVAFKGCSREISFSASMAQNIFKDGELYSHMHKKTDKNMSWPFYGLSGQFLVNYINNFHKIELHKSF